MLADKQTKPACKQIGWQSWIIEFILQDHLLLVTCRSREHQYLLRKEFTEVPQQLSAFGDNLYELTEILINGKSLSIDDKSLIVSFQIGKLKRQIKLELDQQNLSIETRLLNKSQLLQQYKIKLGIANKKIKDLQEKQKEEKQKNIKQIEDLQKELGEEKQKREEAESTIQQFNNKYIECAKWGCQVLIPIDTVRFRAKKNKPICCEQCVF